MFSGISESLEKQVGNSDRPGMETEGILQNPDSPQEIQQNEGMFENLIYK